jgi:group I intron endonuclease
MKDEAQHTELVDNSIAADAVGQGTTGAGGKRKRKRGSHKTEGPCHVYTITLNGTDKTYVGITSRKLKDRFRDHRYHARKGDTNQYIHKAIAKYGHEAFDWQWLCTCENREDAIRAEMTYRAAGWTHYNMTDGGEGVVGCVRSEETCRRISEANKGRPAWNKGIPMSEEQRSLLSAICKERGMNPETAAKAWASNVGRPRTEYQKQKTSEAWTGRKHTEESKAKMSVSRTGLKRSPESIAKEKATKRARGNITSPETIEKLRQSNLGLKHSPERIAKMKAGQIAAKERKALLLAMGPVIPEVTPDA